MANTPDYRIVAKSINQFNEIEDRIKRFPHSVQCMIDVAEKGIVDMLRIDCKKLGGNKMIVRLPPDFIEITIGKNVIVTAKNSVFTYPEHNGEISISVGSFLNLL